MIPLQVTIAGFGPHSNTTVRWNESGPVVALVAPNGSGKTFVIEAPFACLYGEFPSRPGSLADNLTLGGTGEGELETVFTQSGARYIARREVKKSGQKCFLYRALGEGGDPELIAGPKVRDFEAAVEALVGDRRTALATWMAAQGGQGDLTAAQPAERRTVFGKLLGFEELDKKSDRFRDVASSVEAQANLLSSQLVGLPDFADQISIRRITLEAHEVSHRELTGSITRTSAALEAVRGSIRDAQGGDDVLKNQIAALDDVLRQEHQRQLEVAGLAEEVRGLEGRAAGRLEAERADAEVKDLELQLGRLQEADLAFRRRRDWEAEAKAARAAVEAVGRTVASLEAVPGCDEETKATAARLLDIRAEYARAKERNAKAAEANGRRQVLRADLQGRIAALKAKIAQAEGRLALKPETPFGEKCAPCQFLREFAKLPEELAKWRDELAKEEFDLSDVVPDIVMEDLEEITRRGERANAAHAAVEAARSTEARLAACREDLREKEAALARKIANEVPAVDDPAPRRREIEASLATLRPKAGNLALCQDAEARLSGRRAALDTATEELANVRRRVAEAQGPAESARRTLAAREEQLRNLRAEEQKLVAELKEAEAQRDELVRRQATLEAEIRGLNERSREAEEKSWQLERLQARAQRLRTLQGAFGRRGVQPILIDQAAPQLEGIAAALLEKLTDGQMRLRFSTQRALKTGGISEDFLILAADQRGERDVATFSGGEKRLLQTVLRLAMMMWIGRLNGRPAETLCIDEAFDALDAENADRMVSLINDLSRQFGRVIVISHEPEIAERLPSRVRLSKGPMGVQVSCN